MATPPSDGIFIPINLDTSKATEQLGKFSETVKNADMRPNAALDEFFGVVSKNVSEAGDRVRKFQMDMRAMSATAKATGYQFDSSKAGELLRQRKEKLDMVALAAASARPGSMDMAALAKASIQKKTIDATSGMNFYLENKYKRGNSAKTITEPLNKMASAMEASGRAALTGAKYAATAGLGVAASGYAGTTEGNILAREFRVMSLELAAAFKPFVNELTNGTRRIREKLQSMGPEQQDELMNVGLGIGGALAGARVGRIAGWPGMVIGGVAGGVAGYNATQIDDWVKFNRIHQGATQPENYQRESDLFAMNKDQRLVQIEARQRALWQAARDEKNQTEGLDPKSNAFKEHAKNVMAFKEEANALAEIKRRTIKGEPLDDLKNMANPNRRQLQITEGVGFASAGDTYRAIQEEALRATGMDGINKRLDQLIDEQKQLNQNVKNLNK